MSEPFVSEALNLIGPQGLVLIATSSGDNPSLRPVIMFKTDEKYYISASGKKLYIDQLKENPKTEICSLQGMETGDPRNIGFVRLECDTEIVNDKEVKSKVYENSMFLKMFNPTLENYLEHGILVEIQPRKLKYMKQGTFKLQEAKL
jgi:uncharacterized pyridoxamine 5'-phosphate oxidase family protein